MNFVQGMRIDTLESLIAELERGIAIIRDLGVETFRATKKGNGSIGAHFRHNLDFVNSFLNGIAERRIDYNDRGRDTTVETRPAHAVEQMQFAMRRLKGVQPDIFDRIVMVRSEINEDVWHASSVAREIEFLHSHTVHHYALVSKLMAEAGRATGEEFGVAPSTLKFRSGAASDQGSYIAT
ncbi:MAG: hypothetical protein ABI646_04725 [Acidobacteriota bacterium]